MLVIYDRHTGQEDRVHCLDSFDNWFFNTVRYSHDQHFTGERIYLDRFYFFINGDKCSAKSPRYSESVYEQLKEITEWWSKKEKLN